MMIEKNDDRIAAKNAAGSGAGGTSTSVTLTSAVVFLVSCYVIFGAGDYTRATALHVFFAECTLLAFFYVRSTAIASTLGAMRNNIVILSLVLLWIATMTTSLLMTPNFGVRSLVRVARHLHVLMHVLFCAVFFQVVVSQIKVASALYLATVVTVVTMAAAYVAIWIFPASFPQFHDDRNWLTDPPFNVNIRVLGYLIAAASAMAVGHVLDGRRAFRQRLLYAVFGGITLTFLFWAGGRGAMLAIVLTTVVLSAALLWLRISTVKSAVTVLALFAGAMGFAELLAVFEWNGWFASVDRSVAAQGLDDLSSNRTAIWTMALDMIRARPWLGYGAETFFLDSEVPMTNIIQTHNFLLQFLVEWGVVGTILIVVLGVVLAAKIWRALAEVRLADTNRVFIPAFAVGLTLLLHGVTDGSLYHAQSVYLFVSSLAIMLATAGQADVQRRPDPGP